MPVLAVEDMDRSRKFYVDELGFAETFALPGPEGDFIYVGVGLGSGVNILLSKQPDVSDKGKGLVLMVYVPEGSAIDDYYRDIQARGVAIETPIADQYWGDRTFMVIDPDGFYLNFAQTNRQVEMSDIEKVASGDAHLS